MHRNPVCVPVCPCEGFTEALDKPHPTARQPVVTGALFG